MDVDALRRHIADVIEELPAFTPLEDRWTAAARIVRALKPVDQRALATAYIALFVDRTRREDVRATERRAFRPEPTQEELDRRKASLERIAEESGRREAEITDRFHARLRSITDDFKQFVRREFAEELLTSTFATGDGTRVAWGDATIEQHRERITMLTKMASGTLLTAAQHEAAVDLILTTGATCLREALVKA